jgi:hypothetical protein
MVWMAGTFIAHNCRCVTATSTCQMTRPCMAMFMLQYGFWQVGNVLGVVLRSGLRSGLRV